MSAQQVEPKARIQLKHPYLALMGLYLGGFTGMYSETALNIALPQLSAAFGIDLSLTQWMVVGYMLAIGIVLPFSSLLMKWFSARAITLFALAAFLVGSLISGFSTTFALALTGRAIQGIGTGLILPLMFSMVMEVIPPRKIGAAMGINALVIMAASAVGPTLAGLLVGALSWHWIFFSFAIILAVAIVFELKFGVNPYTLTRPSLDWLSIVTSVLGFGGLVLGVGFASMFGWGSLPTIGALVIGIVCLVIYCRRQLTMKVPVINLAIFKYQGFRVGAICVMLNFGITLAVMYILPQFYQNAMLLDVTLAGLIMLPGGIINALVSMIAGKIYDKIGAKIPAMIGFALSIIAAVLLLRANAHSSLAYVMCCHIVLMIGIPLAMSPCQTHALASLPHDISTDGSTMINTMQQIMGALATAIATFLLATGQSSAQRHGVSAANESFAAGAHWGFIFAIALAVIALLLALTLKQCTQPAATASKSAESNLLASLMKKDVYTLSPSATALDALRLFSNKGISGVPVVNDDGTLFGFVSDGDVISTLAQQHAHFSGLYSFTTDDGKASLEEKTKELQTITVGDIATRSVITAQVTDDMRDVCAKLVEHHLKKMPVLDGKKLVGVINRSNITHYTVGLYDGAAKVTAKA